MGYYIDQIMVSNMKAFSIVINITDLELYFIQIMVGKVFLKAIFIKVKLMGLVVLVKQMELIIWGFGILINNKDMAKKPGKMEAVTKVFIKMASKIVMGNIIGPTVTIILANGPKIASMATVFSPGMTTAFISVNGEIIK